MVAEVAAVAPLGSFNAHLSSPGRSSLVLALQQQLGAGRQVLRQLRLQQRLHLALLLRALQPALQQLELLLLQGRERRQAAGAAGVQLPSQRAGRGRGRGVGGGR